MSTLTKALKRGTQRVGSFVAAFGRWTYYGLWLLVEVLVNADGIALDMFRRVSHISPAIVRIPLQSMSSLEVTVFAISITLTPGTLVLAIDHGSTVPTTTLDGVACSGDDGFLLVHSVYAEDLDYVRTQLDIMLGKVLTASRGSSTAAPLECDIPVDYVESVEVTEP